MDFTINNGMDFTKTNGLDIGKMLGTITNTEIIVGSLEPQPPQITKVIFNYPATVVKWSDGTKTVVKCGELDEFDREKGLALAIAKKYYGNTGRYYDEMKKWLQDDDIAQTKKAKKSDKDESCREEIKELLGLLF